MREILPSLALRNQTPPNSVNYDSRERLFLQTNYFEDLLRWIAARLNASKDRVVQ